MQNSNTLESIDKASSSSDIYIWAIMFTILTVGVLYLAYINKDIER